MGMTKESFEKILQDAKEIQNKFESDKKSKEVLNSYLSLSDNDRQYATYSLGCFLAEPKSMAYQPSLAYQILGLVPSTHLLEYKKAQELKQSLIEEINKNIAPSVIQAKP